MADIEPPLFSCFIGGEISVPKALPRIAWRAGLDLNPIDISDREQAAWLETLVWPGQSDRLARLRAAIKVAATIKPRVVAGDLRSDLASLCREAPDDATLVIFHTAVLSYITSQTERDEFVVQAKSLCHYWIANESPRVFPHIARLAGTGGAPGRFLLSVNGAPVAWTDPHGASLDWIAGAAL